MSSQFCSNCLSSTIQKSFQCGHCYCTDCTNIIDAITHFCPKCKTNTQNKISVIDDQHIQSTKSQFRSKQQDSNAEHSNFSFYRPCFIHLDVEAEFYVIKSHLYICKYCSDMIYSSDQVITISTLISNFTNINVDQLIILDSPTNVGIIRQKLNNNHYLVFNKNNCQNLRIVIKNKMQNNTPNQNTTPIIEQLPVLNLLSIAKIENDQGQIKNIYFDNEQFKKLSLIEKQLIYKYIQPDNSLVQNNLYEQCIKYKQLFNLKQNDTQNQSNFLPGSQLALQFKINTCESSEYDLQSYKQKLKIYKFILDGNQIKDYQQFVHQFLKYQQIPLVNQELNQLCDNKQAVLAIFETGLMFCSNQTSTANAAYQQLKNAQKNKKSLNWNESLDQILNKFFLYQNKIYQVIYMHHSKLLCCQVTQQFSQQKVSQLQINEQLNCNNQQITIDLDNLESIEHQYFLSGVMHSANQSLQSNTRQLVQVQNNIKLCQNKLVERIILQSFQKHIFHRINDVLICMSYKIINQLVGLEVSNFTLFCQLIFNNYVINNILLGKTQLYPDKTKNQSHLEKVTDNNFKVNKFVIRNAEDWSYDNQDESNYQVTINGSETVYLGQTIAQSSSNNQICVVFWFNNKINSYRIGYEDKCDLLYFDDEKIVNKMLYPKDLLKELIYLQFEEAKLNQNNTLSLNLQNLIKINKQIFENTKLDCICSNTVLADFMKNFQVNQQQMELFQYKLMQYGDMQRICKSITKIQVLQEQQLNNCCILHQQNYVIHNINQYQQQIQNILVKPKQPQFLQQDKQVFKRYSQSILAWLFERKNKNTKYKTKYHQLCQMQEQFIYNKQLLIGQKINYPLLQKQHTCQYVGIPVFAAATRSTLPAIVTISSDWHSSPQSLGDSNSQYRKIGIMIPIRQVQNDGRVCVKWFDQIKQQVYIIFCEANQMFNNLQINLQYYQNNIASIIQQKQNRCNDIQLNCDVYDGGRNNLYEISYYNYFVTQNNFQQLRLVGPSVQWENTKAQLFGFLMCQANQWAVVYWWDGTLNRHRVGNNGIYELVYVDMW